MLRLLEPPPYRAHLLALPPESLPPVGLPLLPEPRVILFRAAGESTCGAVPVRSVSAHSRRIRFADALENMAEHCAL
jgi:hypothetical protein